MGRAASSARWTPLAETAIREEGSSGLRCKRHTKPSLFLDLEGRDRSRPDSRVAVLKGRTCRVRILELRPRRSVTFQRSAALQPSFAPKTGRAGENACVVPLELLPKASGSAEQQRHAGAEAEPVREGLWAARCVCWCLENRPANTLQASLPTIDARITVVPLLTGPQSRPAEWPIRPRAGRG